MAAFGLRQKFIANGLVQETNLKKGVKFQWEGERDRMADASVVDIEKKSELLYFYYNLSSDFTRLIV